MLPQRTPSRRRPKSRIPQADRGGAEELDVPDTDLEQISTKFCQTEVRAAFLGATMRADYRRVAARGKASACRNNREIRLDNFTFFSRRVARGKPLAFGRA